MGAKAYNIASYTSWWRCVSLNRRKFTMEQKRETDFDIKFYGYRTTQCPKMFLWYGVYFTLSCFLDFRGLPDSCGLAQDVLGVRSEYPLSILRNLARPPPLFLRGLYPLPFRGVARDCFSRQIKRLLFFTLAASPNRPRIHVRECREKGVFRGRKSRFQGAHRTPKKGLF